MPIVYKKDPQAVLDFGFNWSLWLATGETITASTWTVETGLTEDSDAKNDTQTTVWLSGGTAGNIYKAVNKIVTSASRTDERTLEIRVVDR